MRPCHQGANPLVQTFPAQGDGFLKIQRGPGPLAPGSGKSSFPGVLGPACP